MKKLSSLFASFLLLASSSFGEIKSVNIKIFGMD
jgi:hypothetical protein